jgi:hypothetical protein
MSETGRKTRNGAVTFIPEGPVSKKVWDLAAELRVLADNLDQDARTMANLISRRLFAASEQAAGLERATLVRLPQRLEFRAAGCVKL